MIAGENLMKQEKLIFWQKIAVAVTFVLMVTFNILANALPMNQTTAQVSQTYSNMFVPAGYTFSIWGVIYILLALYVLYLFGLFKKLELPKEKLMKINNLFIALNVFNMLWLFTWHFELMLPSVITIITMLIALIIINLEFKELDLPAKQKWMIALPFAVYFGWITVATVANVSAYLTFLEWDMFGWGDDVWMAIILNVVIVITSLTTIRLKSYAYAGAVIWGLIGLFVAQLTTYAGEYVAVWTILIYSVVLLGLSMTSIFLDSKKQEE